MSSEPITIYIKNQLGIGDMLLVSPNLTIQQLNLLIQKTDVVQNTQYQLYFNQKLIQHEELSLKDYQIEDHSVLQIIEKKEDKIQKKDEIKHQIKLFYRGQIFKMNYDQNEGIKSIKNKIQKQFGVLYQNQLLYFQGKQIVDQQQVFFNVEDSIIKLIDQQQNYLVKVPSTEDLKVSYYQPQKLSKSPSEGKIKSNKSNSPQIENEQSKQLRQLGPSPLTPQPQQKYYNSQFQKFTSKWNNFLVVKDVESESDPFSPYPLQNNPYSFSDWILQSPTTNSIRSPPIISLTESIDYENTQQIIKRQIKKYPLTLMNKQNKKYKIIVQETKQLKDIQYLISQFQHVAHQKIELVNPQNSQILTEQFFKDKSNLKSCVNPILIKIKDQ